MKRYVVILVLCLFVLVPVLTAPLPSPCSVDVAAAMDEGSNGESELTFWDWLVMYWCCHLDDWPM